jgi:hypothetical protein
VRGCLLPDLFAGVFLYAFLSWVSSGVCIGWGWGWGLPGCLGSCRLGDPAGGGRTSCVEVRLSGLLFWDVLVCISELGILFGVHVVVLGVRLAERLWYCSGDPRLKANFLGGVAYDLFCCLEYCIVPFWANRPI